jgi:hypothetical protein
LQKIRRKCANYGRIAARIGLISALAANFPGCEPPAESRQLETPDVTTSNECGDHGYLSTELYGAIETTVDWASTDLRCEGMPRPDNMGARLRFSGPISDGRNIAFIIALPDLQQGDTGKEYQTNVTLIEEGNGRFFSTADLEVCWTDIDDIESTDETGNRFEVGGTVYCVAPLPEINGESDVSIRDLKFRGLLDWSAS